MQDEIVVLIGLGTLAIIGPEDIAIPTGTIGPFRIIPGRPVAFGLLARLVRLVRLVRLLTATPFTDAISPHTCAFGPVR